MRTGNWELALFLHVLGATVLFGSTAAIAIAGFAGRTQTRHAALLARVALYTFLLGIVPSWIVMRFAGGWLADKEFTGDEPGWVGVGFIVSEPGAVLLIVVAILVWLSARRGRMMLAVPLLASVYLAALAVAWFAMSAKP